LTPYLFITASRPALGPTQPPIQWVSGAIFLGVNRPGREAHHSRPSSAEVKEWVELYLHSRGAQLKKAEGQLYLYLFNFVDQIVHLMHGSNKKRNKYHCIFFILGVSFWHGLRL